jgi:hypothetical protein
VFEAVEGPGDRALRFSGGVTKARLGGLLLIAGSVITLGLHYLEVP